MNELSSTAMKRLRQTYRESTLLGDVERHVMREAMNSDRDMSYLHPSDMAKTDFCNRWAYYTVTGTEASDAASNPSFQLQNIFAEGHAIHDKWQGWLSRMGVLWGRYQCIGCGTEEFSFGFRCEPCNLDATYKEVALRSEDGSIRGHADGAVKCSDGKMRLIEIKSIGLGTVRVDAPNLFKRYTDGDLSLNDLWREVSRPFSSHIRQGMMYLHLARNVEYLAEVDEIVFLYEFKATQAVKEFVVRFDPEAVEERLADAQTVWESVESGVEPKPPGWASESARTCKSCEYRSKCWRLTNEGGESEQKRITIRRSDSRSRRKVLGK